MAAADTPLCARSENRFVVPCLQQVRRTIDASRLEQHRMVYAAVQARLDDGAIHALALKTRAPEDV